MQGVNTPHNGALVLIVNINTFDVKMVLINPRNSSEIMYHSLFENLKLPASQVRNVDYSVFIFSGEVLWPIAIVEVRASTHEAYEEKY